MNRQAAVEDAILVAPRRRAVALWVLCLAPVAVLPGLNDRWGWPTLLCVGVAAAIALWVPPSGRLPVGFIVLIAGLGLILVIAALAGQAPLSQLLGRSPRYEGAVALPALVATAWAGARLLGPRAPASNHNHAFTAMAAASALLSAVAILESFGLRPMESDLARPGSLAGNATDQGILGAMFTAILGSVVIGTWRRSASLAPWPVVGTLAGIVAVATSASRAALLALGLVTVGLAIRFILTSRRRARDTIVAVGALVGAFGVAMAIPVTRDRIFGVSDFAQQTIADRLFMWDDAWRLFVSTPWLGVGPSGYSDAITAQFGDEWFTRTEVGAILDSPHNIVLQAALAGGVVGVLLAAAVVVGAVVVGARQARTASGSRLDLLLGSLLAIPAAAAALLTHVTSPVTLVPLGMLVGVLVAVAPRDRMPRTWRWTAIALIVLWTLFLAVCTIADAALLQARSAAARGEIDSALTAFDTAKLLRPWDADIALIAAESLGAASENGFTNAADPAAAWAERALVMLPASSRANYVAGMTAFDRRDFGRAADHLARAAALSPADPRTHYQWGVALLLSKDAAAARAPLERAVALAPGIEISWVALGDACRALGDLDCVRRAESGERAAAIGAG